MERYCPHCGERLESGVYNGNPVYLCYTCEYMVGMVIQLRSDSEYATMRKREGETRVSRSQVLLAA